jgi:autotransporter-associated beta strand protein
LGSGVLTINGGSLNANATYMGTTPGVVFGTTGTVINDDFAVNRVTGGGVRIVDFGAGPISLGSNGTSRAIAQGGSAAVYLSGNISDGTGGSKKLILTNASSGFVGSMYLTGSNSYSGGTVINMLNVSTSNQYALSSGGLTMQNDSSINASKLTLLRSLSIDGLLSSGTSVSTNFTGIDLGTPSANATLTLNQSGNSEYGQGIMGSGKLVKSGLGTLTLSGTNTYTGATTVSGGKLIVNSLFNKSMITVQNGGTLGGTGSLKAVTLTAGAILAVGNSPGTMTFDGAVLLSPGSTNLMEIFTSGFDVMKGAATNKLTLAGVNLFDFAGNTVTNGATFTVFQNWGSIVNSNAVFTGINMGAGQGVTVDITGGTGVVTVIPEPAVVGLLSLGAIITLLARRIHR